MVLSLTQFEYDKDTTAILILCGGQTLGGNSTSSRTSGNDGRLFSATSRIYSSLRTIRGRLKSHSVTRNVPVC